MAGPAQQRGHLPSTVEAFRGVPGCQQRVDDHRVADGSGGRGPAALPRPIGPRGDPAAVLTGEPQELLLYLFGRKEHAVVELTGPKAARRCLGDTDLDV